MTDLKNGTHFAVQEAMLSPSRFAFELLLVLALLALAHESHAYQSLDGSQGLVQQAIAQARPGVPTARWGGSCGSCHANAAAPTSALSPFGALFAQPAPTPPFGRVAPTALTPELRARLAYVIGNDPMTNQPFDSDQDGASNLAEVDAGTDPGSALSKPVNGGPIPIAPAPGRDQSGLSVGSPARSMKSTVGCGEGRAAATADSGVAILFAVPMFVVFGLRRRRR